MHRNTWHWWFITGIFRSHALLHALFITHVTLEEKVRRCVEAGERGPTRTPHHARAGPRRAPRSSWSPTPSLPPPRLRRRPSHCSGTLHPHPSRLLPSLPPSPLRPLPPSLAVRGHHHGGRRGGGGDRPYVPRGPAVPDHQPDQALLGPLPRVPCVCGGKGCERSGVRQVQAVVPIAVPGGVGAFFVLVFFSLLSFFVLQGLCSLCVCAMCLQMWGGWAACTCSCWAVGSHVQ